MVILVEQFDDRQGMHFWWLIKEDHSLLEELSIASVKGTDVEILKFQLGSLAKTGNIFVPSPMSRRSNVWTAAQVLIFAMRTIIILTYNCNYKRCSLNVQL